MDVGVLLAQAQICDILARYCHAADRGDWALLRTCYHSDAHDDHGRYSGGVDGLVDYVSAVARSLTYTSHQLGQKWIEVEPGRTTARAETYCFAAYGRRSPKDGSEWFITQGLRYLDRFERRDNRWAISRRAVVMDWEHVSPVTNPPRLDDWLRGAVGPADPAHTFFSTEHLYPVSARRPPEAQDQEARRSTGAGAG